MYFPGRDYLHYWVCNDNRDTYLPPHHAGPAGVTRFIIANPERARQNMRSIYQTNWEEIVYIYGDVPFMFRRDGSKERVGRWAITKTALLDDLAEQVRKYDYIFVKTVEGSFKTFNREYHKHYADKYQWLYEFQRDNPDKKIIVWGNFEFELMFCMGMSGSGMKYNRSMNRSVWLPNGQLINRYRILDEDMKGFEYFLEQYPNQSPHFIAIKMWLAIPEYIKEFYKIPPLRKSPNQFDIDDRAFRLYMKNSRVWYKGRVSYIERKLTAIGAHTYSSRNRAMKRFLRTDGILCDTCSLAYACSLYRKKGTCLVEHTEGKRLSEYFDSTNADDILDGMGKLAAKQAELLETTLDAQMEAIANPENDMVSPTKEVGVMINDLFKNGAKLATLRNPNLTRPQTAIQINSGPQAKKIESGTQRAIEVSTRDKAKAIRELMAMGKDQDEINNDMILDHIFRQKQIYEIEGEVVEGSATQLDNHHDIKDVF